MVEYNAADRKSVRRAEKAAKVAQAAHDAVLANLMSTIQGRAWLWSWLEQCKIFQNPFNVDNRLEAFTLGEANIGRMLLAEIIRVCPEDYIQAMREANERANSTTHRDSDEPATGERPGDEDDGRDNSGSDEAAAGGD